MDFDPHNFVNAAFLVKNVLSVILIAIPVIVCLLLLAGRTSKAGR